MTRLLLALALAVAAFGPVPVWTARWVLAQRKEILDRVSRSVEPLRPCPGDDSLVAFLDRLDHIDSGSSGALWRPMCRKVDPPLGKVSVVTSAAAMFRDCQSHLIANMAQCWLDPPAEFLANRDVPRTFARVTRPDVEDRDVLWSTTMPLAWEGNLEAEHRQAALWVLALSLAGVFTAFCRRQWMQAGKRQWQLGRAQTQPTGGAERFLLCFLPAFNIPQEVDDLRELYGNMLAADGKPAADRWYRRQIRQSLIHYLHQWSRRLWRKVPARSSNRNA